MSEQNKTLAKWENRSGRETRGCSVARAERCILYPDFMKEQFS